jgi:hypothetical protein
MLKIFRSRTARRRRLQAAGLLFALLLTAHALPVRAAKIYPSAGSTAASFLKLEVGARAVAMGGAFTGVPGDPYAVYWNPAALAYLEKEKNLSLFHNEYFQGLGQEFLLYTAPAKGGEFLGIPGPKAGAWGFALNYFYVPDDLERRSGLNEGDPENPISPSEGEFGAYDLAASVVYGRRLRGGLSAGAAIKMIRQSIDNYSAGSVALDLGLLREYSWRGHPVTAGVSVQNLGPGIKFTDRRYGLPLVLRAGVSGRLRDSGALLALDVEKPVDNYPALAVGAEFPLTQRLALRSGYKYRLYGNEEGAWSGFSAGAGVFFDRAIFDYAFTPFGELGNAHRFSISVKFGQPPAAKSVAAQAAPLPGGAPVVYSVTARPMGMSPRGVKYDLAAAAEGPGLYAFSFRTLLRDPPPAVLTFVVGELAPSLPALPAGVRALRVWQSTGFPGGLMGPLKLNLRLEPSLAPEEKVMLFYGNGKDWKVLTPVFERVENGFNLFSAEVPGAGYYAVGVRE